MILAIMRIPPSPTGHGGSQRAWALLRALADLGPVDFVLICRKSDKDAASISLEPVRTIARTVRSIDIPEWQPASNVGLGPLRKLHTGWIDLARMRSQEAPRISAAGLERIADQLPVRTAKLIFAGRLPSAVVVDALMDRGLLTAERKVVDFDDVMSGFRRRQLASPKGVEGPQSRLLAHIDVRLMQRAEARIARDWDAISVCTDHDVADLQRAYPSAMFVKVPNVIERPLLAPTAGDGSRLLFVGNLSFAPNVQGLQAFLEQAWPLVRQRLPNATLKVVGMMPHEDVQQACRRDGVTLHADVPSVEPYYADTDIVICPILFGGGTRIKVLEAMAYGRAVVATSLGAEGLEIVSGREAILADTMIAFAEGVLYVANDPALRETLVTRARALQQNNFGYPAMAAAVKRMATASAARSSTNPLPTPAPAIASAGALP